MRINEKKIKEKLKNLRKKLEDLEKWFRINKPDKLQEYCNYTIDIINGFSIVNENGNPNIWRHLVGSDVLRLYDWLKENNFNIDLLKSIKQICSDIFYLSYNYGIDDINNIPDFFFIKDKENKNKRENGIPFCIFIFICILTIIYWSIHNSFISCLKHEKLFSAFMFDNCFWNFIALFLVLLAWNEFNIKISNIIKCIKCLVYSTKIGRKFVWFKFRLISSIKHYFLKYLDYIVITVLIFSIIFSISFLER